MLSSNFTEIAIISAIVEGESSEIDDTTSAKYDEFGNTLKDISTTEYEDSCSLYDCESSHENEETITEGILLYEYIVRA